MLGLWHELQNNNYRISTGHIYTTVWNLPVSQPSPNIASAQLIQGHKVQDSTRDLFIRSLPYTDYKHITSESYNNHMLLLYILAFCKLSKTNITIALWTHQPFTKPCCSRVEQLTAADMLDTNYQHSTAIVIQDSSARKMLGENTSEWWRGWEGGRRVELLCHYITRFGCS